MNRKILLMKMLKNILVCFLLSSSSLCAQQIIKGFVILEDSKDFSGVRVQIEGSNKYSETNKNGEFWIEVANKEKVRLILEKSEWYLSAYVIEKPYLRYLLRFS